MDSMRILSKIPIRKNFNTFWERAVVEGGEGAVEGEWQRTVVETTKGEGLASEEDQASDEDQESCTKCTTPSECRAVRQPT